MFSKKSHLVRHSSVPKICVTCNQVFCSGKNHKKSAHPSYSCEHCKKSFEDNAHLRRHIGSIQTKAGVWVNKCELCEVNFCTLKELGKHKKSHKHMTSNCNFCDGSFKTKWNLKVHMSNRKELLCPQCGKSLCNNYDLKVHMNSAHGQKMCPVYNIEYSNENYKLHMLVKHKFLT